ncbi:MAG: MerR family DNA-binding transcriptional regulator [Myxococcota bacterium]
MDAEEVKSELISIQDAARLLDVTPKTLRRWDAAGKLRAIRDPTGRLRYRPSELWAIRPPRLFGREALLREMLDAPSRLLTLVGLPGIGRSALCRVFGSRCPSAWVDLQHQPDVEGAVRSALGGSVKSALAGRTLVLDHALTAAVQPFAKRWLADGARLVVVPDAPLRVPGERILIVRPLDGDAATDLCEAQGVSPEETHRRVRGAAGHPMALQQQDVAPRLAARWNATPTPLRTALRAASVFASAFDLDAAEAVLGVSVDTLEELVARGWLLPGGDRFTVHPILRAYLREPAAGANERHADYHLEPSAPARVEELLAIAERFPELGPSALLRAPDALLEVSDRDRVRAALSHAIDNSDCGVQAQLLAVRAHLHAIVGDSQPAKDDVARARQVNAPAAERALVAWRTSWVLLYLLKDPQSAAAGFEEARDAAQAVADVALEGRALGGLASALQQQGKYDAAIEAYRACLALAELTTRPEDRAAAYANLAGLEMRRGHYGEAVRLCEAAIDIYRQDAPRKAAISRGNLLRVFLEAGDLDECAARFSEARENAVAMGEQNLIALIDLTGAWLDAERGDLEKAIAAASAIRHRARAHSLAHVDAVASLDHALFRLRRGDAVVPELSTAAGGLDLSNPPLALLARAFEAAVRSDSDHLAQIAGETAQASVHIRDAIAALQGNATSVRGCRARLAAAWVVDHAQTLTITAEGFRFGGRSVSLKDRPTLLRILTRLIEGGDVQALLDCGWPSESLRARRSRHRVYGAIRSLRSMGLTCITNVRGCYRIDARVVYDGG